MSFRYVFFGTPGFCLRALDQLVAAGYQPSAVVCQPDRPRGRGRRLTAPATKAWAQALAVPVHQPHHCRDGEFLTCMQQVRPDLGLVYAFGQILPKRLLEIPRLGFINIHPSLLPRWRGAAPVQWALLDGDRRTGVSIVRMTPRLDDGPILAQQELEIAPEEDAVQLGERLAELGGRLAVEVVRRLDAGERIPEIAQDESRVTWAPALSKQDGRLDWNQPAARLHDRVRGLQPWPGAWTRLQGKVLKVCRARTASEAHAGAAAGEVVEARGERLVVACGKGSLQLLEVQLEGRKRMSAQAFLAGRGIAAGMRLG